MLEALMAFAMSAFPFSQSGSDSQPVISASWSCDAEQWVSPPVVEGGVYKGHIYSNCLVKDGQGGGLPALDQLLLGQVTRSRQVHAGPIAETYEGLPGVRYDVTIGGADGSDSITMRQDSHVATDGTRRSLYVTLSKDIQGSGLAGYLKRVNIRVEVWATPQTGVYRLQASNYVEADKPWYAPGGVFRSQAEKAQKEQYLKIRNRTVPEMAAVL